MAVVSGRLAPAVGVVSGKVVSPQKNAVIVGATVTANGLSKVTGTSGYYAFTLPYGTYTITASAPGFKTQSVSNVTIDVDHMVVEVDFSLFEAVNVGTVAMVGGLAIAAFVVAYLLFKS